MNNHLEWMILTKENIYSIEERKKETKKKDNELQKKKKIFFNKHQQEMIYSVADGWSSDGGRLKIRSNRLAEVKISVQWDVLGRTIASRCGSSPNFRGRLHLHLHDAADGLVEQDISLVDQAISLVEQDISLVEQAISLVEQVISLFYQTDGLFYQAISSTLKMETKSVSETSKNFHILMWLSAWELLLNFVAAKASKLI